MARIIGGLTTSHIPSIGNAVPREDGIGERSVLEAFLRRLSAGAGMAAEGEAGRGHRHLQRSRPELLSRQDADLCHRSGARVPQCRRRLGHSYDSAVPRRSRSFLAHHRIRRRGAIRPGLLPGNAGGPRLHRAHVAVLAQQFLFRREDDSRLHQHGAASAAVAHALLQTRPGDRPRHRILSEGPQSVW